MDDILKLAKNYTIQQHLKLLPHYENNILNNLVFLYDESWENQASYPYEILTYLFDSYYVLPKRPDLATLFCWQAINRSYYEQQLNDTNITFCQDTRGIELIANEILENWTYKYKIILEPFIENLPIKVFHYVASYLLKGYIMEINDIPQKFMASSYKSLKKKIPTLETILTNSYGKSYSRITHPIVEDNKINLKINITDSTKSRNIIHSFALKLQLLAVGQEVNINFSEPSVKQHTYAFTVLERLSFVLFGILYASRCNNFHGNVASRMNSVCANIDTFKMYTDLFLIEYIILAIHMNSQRILSDTVLNNLKSNVDLMV